MILTWITKWADRFSFLPLVSRTAEKAQAKSKLITRHVQGFFPFNGDSFGVLAASLLLFFPCCQPTFSSHSAYTQASDFFLSFQYLPVNSNSGGSGDGILPRGTDFPEQAASVCMLGPIKLNIYTVGILYVLSWKYMRTCVCL